MASIIERDVLRGNLLDRLDSMEERIRILEATHPGLAGSAAGKLAYYGESDGDLVLPGGGADIVLEGQPLAFGRVVSLFSLFPGLRGLWTMADYDTSGNAEDRTNYDLLLTRNGGGQYDYDGLAPLYNLGGATYFTRADEAALSITGTEAHIDTGMRGITLGGWVRCSDTANQQYLQAKWGAAGSQSYLLVLRGDVAGDPVDFFISDDGTNSDSVRSSNTYSGGWTFILGRFCDNDSGQELALFVNGIKTVDTTARASIDNNGSSFSMGGGAGGGNTLTGYLGLQVLCASALSDDMIGAAYQQSRALYGV